VPFPKIAKLIQFCQKIQPRHFFSSYARGLVALCAFRFKNLDCVYDCSLVPSANEKLTIGLDLGDRNSRYCVLDEQGEALREGSIPRTRKGLDRVLGTMPRGRIALEVGTHSPWVSRHLARLGYEVIVANARRVRLITESSRKGDKLDAKTLARLARIDPELLSPIRHRSE